MEKAEIKFNFGSLMKDIDKRSREGLEIKFLINSTVRACRGVKVMLPSKIFLIFKVRVPCDDKKVAFRFLVLSEVKL